MAEKNCAICGEPAGMMKMKYPDGVVCRKCFGKANGAVSRLYKSVAEVQLVLDRDLSTITPEEKAALVGKLNKLDEEAKDQRMAGIQTKIRDNNTPITRVESAPVPKCPKCGSASISANKKGFGVGKAVVGTAIAGPLGAVAGNIGSKKVLITCLNCGHQWQAGKS